MDCFISFVIPYYCTSSELFNRCMSSILSTELDNIEIIVIDDGSPKEYQPIVDAYASYKHVRIIRTSNEGVSAARNRGIQEAKGKWILFIDSDDYINTFSLNLINDFAKDYEGDVVILNGGRDINGTIDYNTTFLQQGINYASTKEGKLRLMESALSLGKIPRGYVQYFTLGAPYCKLIRVDFLKQNDLIFDTDVKFAEDTLFSLNLYHNAKEIQYLDLYFYYYDQSSGSVTRKYRPGLSKDMDVFFEKTKSFLDRNDLYKDLEYAFLLRAEFEVLRSLKFEFFHIQNTDKDANQKYIEFIRKEPYRTALKKDYFPPKNIKQRVFRAFIKRGYGKIWYMARRIKRRAQ